MTLSADCVRKAATLREKFMADKGRYLRRIFVYAVSKGKGPTSSAGADTSTSWRCPNAADTKYNRGGPPGRECLGTTWTTRLEEYEQHSFDVFVRSAVEDMRPCEQCKVHMKKLEKRMRHILWERLPSYCGLDGWPTAESS